MWVEGLESSQLRDSGTLDGSCTFVPSFAFLLSDFSVCLIPTKF